MKKYRRIATLIVRAFALSYFIMTAFEFGMIALDWCFVRAGIFPRSLVSYELRWMYSALYLLIALFLYYQSPPVINFLLNNLDKNENETINQDDLKPE